MRGDQIQVPAASRGGGQVDRIRTHDTDVVRIGDRVAARIRSRDGDRLLREDRLLCQLAPAANGVGGGDARVGIENPVERLRSRVGRIDRPIGCFDELTRAEQHDQTCAGRPESDLRTLGDRLGVRAGRGRPVVRRKQGLGFRRRVEVRNAPGALGRTGHVELPHVALQVAGIHVVDDAVAVDVDDGRRRQSIGSSGATDLGVDLLDQRTGPNVDDEQDRVTGTCDSGRVATTRVVAVAEDRDPLAVVHLDYRRAAVGIPEIGVIGVRELPQQIVGRSRLSECGGIGHVQGKDLPAAFVQARDEDRVPRGVAAEECIDHGRRTVLIILVRVVRLRQAVQVRQHDAGDEREHLLAGTRGIRSIRVRARIEGVQQAIVGADVNDGLAARFVRAERAIGHRLHVVAITESRGGDINGR